MTSATKNIIHKFETLPESLVNEAEDFIDFLKTKHGQTSNEQHKVEEPKSLYRAAKGTILHISDDFNAPLEDFK